MLTSQPFLPSAQSRGLPGWEYVNSIPFDNGYTLDVRVVICEEEKPYIDLVLLNEHGQEVGCDVHDGQIQDPIDLEYDEVRFVASITGVKRSLDDQLQTAEAKKGSSKGEEEPERMI